MRKIFTQVVNVGEKLNDGAWHILKIKRQGMRVIASLDNANDFVSSKLCAYQTTLTHLAH